QRADRGRRGARALAAPHPGGDRTRPVHPDRRAERPDRADRPLGARTRMQAGGGVASRGPPDRDRREHLRSPAGPPLAGRRRRAGAGRERLRRRFVDAGGDRDGPDARRLRGGDPPGGAQGAGREDRDRRLRHRLQLDGLPASVPGRRAEDRPLLHRRGRDLERGGDDGPHARPARQVARVADVGRGDRGPRPALGAAARTLRPRPGVPVRETARAGRGREGPGSRARNCGQSLAVTAATVVRVPAFKLDSVFTPTADQPRAIEAMAEGIVSGERFQTLLGATGTGKTMTMAGVIEAVQRPTLVIAHNKTLAAQLCNEFRTFFPDNAVEYFVSYYDYYQPEAYVPSRDLYIEKDSAINQEVDRLRHAATAAVFARRDVIVVASVSCIYGLGSPQTYEMNMQILRRGEEIDRDKLLRKLVSIQYTRNDSVLARGTFRVKGETLEVFPAYAETAFRARMFGDEVERLQHFDPLTGELLEDDIEH